MEIIVNRFLQLLIEENQHQNLVSRQTSREDLDLHVKDSLEILQRLSMADQRIVDIGSGAGERLELAQNLGWETSWAKDGEPAGTEGQSLRLEAIEIRIIKNGHLAHRHSGEALEYPVPAPGVYRAEVYYHPRLGKPRPWLYANPIYIRE